MSPPKFQRATPRTKKEWDGPDLDELERRVEACENFNERVNDYLHEDDGDGAGNDKLRNFFLKKFASDPDMVDLVDAATEDD